MFRTRWLRTWWAQAQLAAAWRYKQQIDADWTPGEQFTRHVWTTEEAWQALLTHLGSYGADVRVDDGEIRVLKGTEKTIYRIDPEAWTAYLTGPEITDQPRNSQIVPVATPLVDGLPLWVVDELDEVAGAWGPVVSLHGGRLMGSDVQEDPEMARQAELARQHPEGIGRWAVLDRDGNVDDEFRERRD